MAELPPSLGDDAKAKLRLSHEESPLPSTRKEIVSRFEAILNQGGVQKVVIEIGKPIKVARYVKEGADIQSLREEELFAEARNAPMEEFVSDAGLPFHEYLFKAFHIVMQKRLKPRAFLVSNEKVLRTNLGVDSLWDLSHVYGIDVVKAPEVPPDVLLLTATADGEAIALSIRLLMQVSEKKP